MNPMTRRRARSAVTSLTLTLGLVGGAVTLAPAPSYAESVAVDDVVGDAMRLGDNGYEPAPRAKAGDLVRTRFDYRGQVLVVRGTAVKAAAGTFKFVRVKGGGRDQYFYAFGRQVEGDEEGGPCAGSSVAVNKKKAMYTVKIPARCFGSPDRVRVGLGLGRLNTSNEAYTIDDAQRDGFSDKVTNLRLGRALTRG